MPMPLTFAGLRGDRQSRSWYRCSDLIGAARAAGWPMNRYEVQCVIAHLPKPTVKRYGHWQYGQEHMDALLKFCLTHKATQVDSPAPAV